MKKTTDGGPRNTHTHNTIAISQAHSTERTDACQLMTATTHVSPDRPVAQKHVLHIQQTTTGTTQTGRRICDPTAIEPSNPIQAITLSPLGKLEPFTYPGIMSFSRRLFSFTAPTICRDGRVVKCRTCDREVAGSNPARGCCVPTSPTQRAIPPGSVNEYQRKLGSKRTYHAMH